MYGVTLLVGGRKVASGHPDPIVTDMLCHTVHLVNMYIYIPYLCADRDMNLYPNFGWSRGCPNKNIFLFISTWIVLLYKL